MLMRTAGTVELTKRGSANDKPGVPAARAFVIFMSSTSVSRSTVNASPAIAVPSNCAAEASAVVPNVTLVTVSALISNSPATSAGETFPLTAATPFMGAPDESPRVMVTAADMVSVVPDSESNCGS